MDYLLAVQPVYRWAITLAFVGIVIALSITPGIERPDDSVFGWLVVNTATPLQKAMHLAVYAILAALWIWTLQFIESGNPRIVVAVLVTILLGAALECYQVRVPGRFGSLTDVFLNAVGALVGAGAALYFLYRSQ